jgi:pre-mRNA cleavage complex 2 protein Pcf11
MVAEDHANSAKAAASIYRCIQQPLLKGPRESKLPLVYVIDSILKNVKGKFTIIIQNDAKNWMPLVYTQINQDQKAKLKKTWNSWNQFNIFDEAPWREMGACFLTNDGVAQLAATSSASNGGIVRSADGELQLNPRVRKQMQLLLDDAQSSVDNELDKVSLERLADINPDLLLTIQKQAEEVLAGGGRNGHSDSSHKQQLHLMQPFAETRSSFSIQRSLEWNNLTLNHAETSKALIQQLQTLVDQQLFSEAKYTAEEALVMTTTLSAAATVAVHVQSFLDALETQQSMQPTKKKTKAFSMVNKENFTNAGVKERNENIIAMLYEMGLPFVSSSDGQRFATQMELSKHLDSLFKKNQLNKNVERTEERGWFVSQDIWIGLTDSSSPNGVDSFNPAMGETDKMGLEDEDPNKWTVAADESRDKCVICGIHFKMEFDNDDGIYKYSNSREIEVLNDDAAERESETMLVHVTCWRGLGSPPVLTLDQTLQD